MSDIRTLAQNDKMWPMLRDIAKQVQWPVNGKLEWMAPEDWKDIFTSALVRESRVAQGLEGGWVLLGVRTSSAKRAFIVNMIELMYAFGNERGVRWTDPEWLALLEQEAA